MEARAKVTACELGRAKTGTPQVILEFYIISGTYKECTAMWYGNLSGGALEITLEGLRTCGWNGNIAELETCKRNEVRVTLLVEGPKVSIRYINPLKRVLSKDPLNAGEVSELQKLIDGHGPVRQREPGDDDLAF